MTIILQGAKGSQAWDKHSEPSWIMSSSTELLKNFRETAAGELSKWKKIKKKWKKKHSVCVCCGGAFLKFLCSFHISDKQLSWLSPDRVSVSPLSQGKLICGEILTQNGRHESPRRTWQVADGWSAGAASSPHSCSPSDPSYLLRTTFTLLIMTQSALWIMSVVNVTSHHRPAGGTSCCTSSLTGSDRRNVMACH